MSSAQGERCRGTRRQASVTLHAAQEGGSAIRVGLMSGDETQERVLSACCAVRSVALRCALVLLHAAASGSLALWLEPSSPPCAFRRTV